MENRKSFSFVCFHFGVSSARMFIQLAISERSGSAEKLKKLFMKSTFKRSGSEICFASQNSIKNTMLNSAIKALSRHSVGGRFVFRDEKKCGFCSVKDRRMFSQSASEIERLGGIIGWLCCYSDKLESVLRSSLCRRRTLYWMKSFV